MSCPKLIFTCMSLIFSMQIRRVISCLGLLTECMWYLVGPLKKRVSEFYMLHNADFFSFLSLNNFVKSIVNKRGQKFLCSPCAETISFVNQIYLSQFFCALIPYHPSPLLNCAQGVFGNKSETFKFSIGYSSNFFQMG